MIHSVFGIYVARICCKIFWNCHFWLNLFSKYFMTLSSWLKLSITMGFYLFVSFCFNNKWNENNLEQLFSTFITKLDLLFIVNTMTHDFHLLFKKIWPGNFSLIYFALTSNLWILGFICTSMLSWLNILFWKILFTF